MFLNVFFVKKIYLEKTKKKRQASIDRWSEYMILSLPLHRFTVPQRTMQQEWKALKFCYFLLLLDSVKLNKLLMVFCKTASFFLGVEVLRNGYTLNGFSFSIHRRLAISDEKKVEKKEKRRLTKRTVLWYILFRLRRTETARFKRIGLWNKREGKEEKAKEQNLW